MEGQFVTLNNDKTEHSLLDKVYTPRNKSVFKIISVNKDSFSVSVRDILTGSVSEVLTSRVQPLSLADLELAHFGTPALYRRLALLTNKMRRKYQPGTQRSEGLKLLGSLPEETNQAVEGDAEHIDVEDEQDVRKAEEDIVLGPVEDMVLNTEEDVRHDSREEHSHDEKPEIIDNADSHIEEEDNKVGVTTRYRGSKHVRVFYNDVGRVFKIQSILKKTSYSPSDNLDIAMFRTSDRATFAAHQVGLKGHTESCGANLCDICKFAQNVSRFTWDIKNYSRYLKPLESTQSGPKPGPKKRISFNTETIVTKKRRGFQVNMNTLSQACFYNISLPETALIN